MRCVNCGNEVLEGRRFCGFCGADQMISGGIKTSEGNDFAQKETERALDASAENTYEKNVINYNQDGEISGQAGTVNPVNQNYRSRLTDAGAVNRRGKAKNSMVLAAVIGALMIISAIVVAVGVFGFGWLGDKSPKKDPAETVNVAFNAINRNDSKTFFNCFKPEIRNSAEASLKSVISGFGTMFGGEAPNSYELLNKTLEYTKFVLGIEKVELNNTEVTEGEVNGSTAVTGDLYLGTMDAGKLKVELEMADGIWYISNIDTKNLRFDDIISQVPAVGSLLEKNKGS